MFCLQNRDIAWWYRSVELGIGGGFKIEPGHSFTGRYDQACTHRLHPGRPFGIGFTGFVGQIMSLLQ